MGSNAHYSWARVSLYLHRSDARFLGPRGASWIARSTSPRDPKALSLLGTSIREFLTTSIMLDGSTDRKRQVICLSSDGPIAWPTKMTISFMSTGHAICFLTQYVCLTGAYASF